MRSASDSCSAMDRRRRNSVRPISTRHSRRSASMTWLVSRRLMSGRHTAVYRLGFMFSRIIIRP